MIALTHRTASGAALETTTMAAAMIVTVAASVAGTTEYPWLHAECSKMIDLKLRQAAWAECSKMIDLKLLRAA